MLIFICMQNPMGSGLALAISQASHFLQPSPHQSIIIERMHSGETRTHMYTYAHTYAHTCTQAPTNTHAHTGTITVQTAANFFDNVEIVLFYYTLTQHCLIMSILQKLAAYKNIS